MANSTWIAYSPFLHNLVRRGTTSERYSGRLGCTESSEMDRTGR